MTAYIIRRLLWGVLLLVLVIAVTFVVFYLLPSVDPAVLRAGRNGSPKIIAQIRKDLGLNHSVFWQFFHYIGNVVQLNFGYSYYYNVSVGSLIVDRLPATLSLTVGAAVLWVIVGIPVGIVSAIKRRTFVDRAAMGTALVFVSAPVFWLGLVSLYLFASDIGRFPVFPGSGSYAGLTSDPRADLAVLKPVTFSRSFEGGYTVRTRAEAFGFSEQIGQILIPEEEVVELRNGKKVTSKRLIYPGYVLVEMEMNDELWHAVKATPRVTGFVGGGTSPVPLTADEVNQILYRQATSAERPRPKMTFEKNDNVRIVDGPFANFSGKVDEVNPERGTLRVMVTIFGRATPVELEFLQVEKA